MVGQPCRVLVERADKRMAGALASRTEGRLPVRILDAGEELIGTFQEVRITSAAELSLSSVVEPFDDLERRRQCLLGRRECSDSTPCGAHHRWKEVADHVTCFFRETTVEDLIEDD